MIALNKWIIDEEENINTELFKKYFKFQRPSDIVNYLYKINDKEKNNNLMNMINSGLKNLKKKLMRCLKKKKKLKSQM